MRLINDFKIGIRNLARRKSYTLLNLLGLLTGMTCCLLIFHYVSYERSYDSEIKDAENIYRIRLDNYQQGKLAWKSATSYPGIPPAMKKDFPEVEKYCRLIDANMLLVNEEKNVKFNENQGYYAEPAFLAMFNLTLQSGNSNYALTGPDKIIISKKMAEKYFGTDHVVGRKLTVKDGGQNRFYEITGVFNEYPKNSHLSIEYLVSYDTFKKIMRDGGDTTNSAETSFGWYDFYSYLKLKPGTDIKKLEAKFPAFCERYITWAKQVKSSHEIHLIPVKDIHLYSNYNQEAEINGSGQMMSFLFLIAIFIIGIAWMNHINLSTARSVERAKEVGIKKVMGALRTDLIKQFLLENFILNFLSAIIAISIFFVLVKSFDAFAGRDGFTGIYLTPLYWQIFILLFFGGTLLSGIYPALALSGFQPIRVLKGVFKNSVRGVALRKGLIVVQFGITIALLAGTVIVYQQVQYMRNAKLGVNIDQTLVLRGPSTIQDSAYEEINLPFKSELLQQPGIKNVSASSNVMGQEIYWTNGSRRLGTPKESSVTLYNLGVDYDFIPGFDMKLKAGRNFSKEFRTDNKAAILNENAARLLGFESPKDAVDKKIKRGRDTLTVIGVVADYHHEGLQKAIAPLLIVPFQNTRQYYSIKINMANASFAIKNIESTWNKYYPGDPYNYFFLNDSFNKQYKNDVLFGKVFTVFTVLAILIACLGLLGLSSYNVLQRQKEISIRKVLGASAKNIFLLLSKDFLKLIFVSFLIAFPAGWYIMNNWLQDFAYRIHMQWWVFVLSGIAAFGIATATIVLQVINTVLEKPVKSLRTE